MNTPAAENLRRCSDCGLEIPSGELGNRCPHCLLRLALDPDTDGPDQTPGAAPFASAGLPSRFFGDYELLQEISRGGMGVVFKARQLSVNRLVALKMIQPGHLASPETRLRFRMEIEAVARLSHPHIVSLHESGEVGGVHFYTMTLVEGGNLAERLAARNRSDGDEAGAAESDLTRRPGATQHAVRRGMAALPAWVELMAKVCRAVHYAHQRGILHRDLKPSNILLDAKEEPHVADFGLAKVLVADGGVTQTQSILGSPGYMAPEQASSRADHVTVAADVYSLGAILYEILAGQPPFKTGTALETLRRVVEEEPASPRTLNPGIDADLETVCLKCLQKAPGARYGSAEELADDLERWLGDLPVHARPVTRAEQFWRWCKRHPAVAVLSVALVLSLIGTAIGASVATSRIRRAERVAVAHLRESLLDQARILRLTSSLGGRTECLRLIGEAAALGGSVEFRRRARDEMLATLARSDVRFAALPRLPAGPDAPLHALDPKFNRLASLERGTTVVVRTVAEGRELSRFSVDEQPVMSLEQFSPDGRFIVLRGRERFSVWDAESGRRCYAARGTNFAYCFAPDEPVLLLEEGLRQISFLELPSARPVRRVEVETDDFARRYRGWRALAISPDGRTLAASLLRSRVIELFDAESGQLLRRLTNSAALSAMAWSADSARLATATADGLLPVWVPATGARHMRLPPMPAAARSVAFSPDGRLLAAACEDHAIRFVDTEAFRYAFDARGAGHRIAFDAAGTRLGPLFRGQEPGWFEITRPMEFREWCAGETSVELDACQFSPDGRIVLVGNDTNVVFCDATTGAELQRGIGWRITSAAFDPLANRVVAGGPPGLLRWTLRATDAPSFRLVGEETIMSRRGWRAFAFTPDGRWFAAANINSNAAFVFDHTLTNLSAAVGAHVGPDSIAISPEARWLATGSSRDHRIKVWEVQTGKEVFSTDAGRLPNAVFSGDGKWLATFGGGGFELRRTGTWAPAPPLPFPGGRPALGAAAFSPDGRLLAVVADLFNVQLFDLVTFEPAGLLQPPGAVRINGVAFSPDSSRFAAVGPLGRVRVWDLRRIHQRLADAGLDSELPSLSPLSSPTAGSRAP